MLSKYLTYMHKPKLHEAKYIVQYETGSGNKIAWTRDDKDTIAYIDIQEYNHKEIKTFFDVVHTLMQRLALLGVKKIRQSVTETDYHLLKDSGATWEVYTRSKTPVKVGPHVELVDIYTLECDIGDVIDNVRKGLGV